MSAPVLSVAAGLAAALCWGVADFTVARTSARLGASETFGLAQPLGAGAVLLLGGVSGVTVDPTAVANPRLLAVGALGAVSYLLLYRALWQGPIAITSPVGSTYGAIAALLAVVFTAETLGGRGVVGLVLVTAGVVVASTDPGQLTRLDEFGGVKGGVASALLAALGLGSMLFSLESAATGTTTLTAIFVVRVVGTVIATPVLVRTFLVERSPLPSRAAAGVGAVGTLDSAAFVAFLLGVRNGQVAVVSPLGSLFAVVTVLLARLFLEERLSRVQFAGIVCVFVGTPILATH